MRDHDTTDGDKLRIDRGDSWNVEFDDIPNSFDVLDMKVTRILEEMEAQREKIKKLEAALQQEIAEKNQLQMRNAQLESVLERAKSNLEGALLMKDTVREEVPKNMTSETNELREELQKLRDESQKTCDETKQVPMKQMEQFT
ncbi:unnamed protein product [Anisakis simplex]|uniref:Coiled-coil domain-containing protein 39 n=1 Tax=Anisakis simplex TaxID=6269 RepID=A0A0M3J6X9_ANISI|nr:unnamed protein product [Anisakis simplex]